MPPAESGHSLCACGQTSQLLALMGMALCAHLQRGQAPQCTERTTQLLVSSYAPAVLLCLLFHRWPQAQDLQYSAACQLPAEGTKQATCRVRELYCDACAHGIRHAEHRRRQQLDVGHHMWDRPSAHLELRPGGSLRLQLGTQVAEVPICQPCRPACASSSESSHGRSPR